MRRKVKEVVAIVLLLSILFIFAIKRHAIHVPQHPDSPEEPVASQNNGAGPEAPAEENDPAIQTENSPKENLTEKLQEKPEIVSIVREETPGPDVLPANERLGEPKYVIIIFGWRRAASLKRLCDSLLKAHYDGVNVDISFHIDGEASEAVTNLVADFKWNHGAKKVQQHATQIGLVQNVMTSWSPTSNDEYAIFLEDDIEVSPWYFKWIQHNIALSRNLRQRDYDRFFGISLYTPRLNEITFSPMKWDPHSIVKNETSILFQLPCSWGAVYYPQRWIEFKSYFDWRQAHSNIKSEIVPNSKSNLWQRSWKKYEIPLI